MVCSVLSGCSVIILALTSCWNGVGEFGFCFSLGGNCNCQFDGERPPVINWFESAPYSPPSRYHNGLFDYWC